MFLAWLVACVGPVDDSDPGQVAPIVFGFPLPEPDRFPALVGVDHDPVVQPDTAAGGFVCSDYLGRPWPHCYDEHDGSDYILDGGFDAMDAGSSPIVAAAPGVVLETDDGHYDRCHVDPEASDRISCDGYPQMANYVIVEHEGGYQTWYWHMKTDSVAVSPGDSVECGDLLGLVGSSGTSSGPHLHFEVETPDGVVIDPYAGPNSQPESYWEDQRETDVLPGAGCAGG